MSLLALVGCMGSVAPGFELQNVPGERGDTGQDAGEETAGADSAAGDDDSAADSGDEVEEVDTRPAGSCAPEIPVDARVLTDDAEVEEDDVLVWVCRGATVSAAGSTGAFFVDTRAELVLSGQGGRAWIRSGSTLNVFDGPNELWVEDGADVYIDALGVVVNECPTLTFTGGPADGC